ncbi:MAG TPA: DoxX family protein [Chitinophagaceae bacterium]
MSMLQQIEKWSSAHHPRWLIVLRVALGLCLFIKGISFISNITTIETLLQKDFPNSALWIAYAITWIHLFGGLMLVIGLLTRFAVILQIPILIGAIVLVNTRQNIFTGSSELLFSIVILLLLFLFLVEGGGPLSLDDYFKKHPRDM